VLFKAWLACLILLANPVRLVAFNFAAVGIESIPSILLSSWMVLPVY